MPTPDCPKTDICKLTIFCPPKGKTAVCAAESRLEAVPAETRIQTQCGGPQVFSTFSKTLGEIQKSQLHRIKNWDFFWAVLTNNTLCVNKCAKVFGNSPNHRREFARRHVHSPATTMDWQRVICSDWKQNKGWAATIPKCVHRLKCKRTNHCKNPKRKAGRHQITATKNCHWKALRSRCPVLLFKWTTSVHENPENQIGLWSKIFFLWLNCLPR